MLIDGKAIANQIQKEIKLSLSKIAVRKPCLAVIIVGEHPPSLIYVERKTKACSEVGISSIKLKFQSSITEAQLIQEIHTLNQNEDVDGILVQLPLPAHIDPLKIIQSLAPEKDVDGLHPINVGKTFIGDTSSFSPCTPLGIKELLIRSNIEVAGKHVLILGRSNLVGKPMAALLMQNCEGGNATVTVANSQTKNLKSLCLSADIIIAAIGQPLFLTADRVQTGAVVIDVGINRIPSNIPPGYKIVGDVDFENVKDKCAAISPVPGGVGPMTIAMLLKNTLKSYLTKFPL